MACLVASVLVAPRAGAQSTDAEALAQALFTEGRALLAKNQTSEACAKFEESVRLVSSSGALLNLGLCHERLGKLASASVELSESLARAKKENRADREAIAREHLASVEARLSRLAVNVPASSEVEGLEVKLDGLVLRKAAWGVATGVDPGVHSVEASAPGHQPFRATVDVKGEKESLRIEVPRLQPVAGASATPVPVPATALPAPTDPAERPSPPPGAASSREADRADADPGRAQRRIGLIVGAAGIVATGVGVFFALDASSTWSDAESKCPGLTCRNATDRELGSNAGTSADLATVLLLVGGGALAAGTTLFFTAPSRRSTALRVTPSLGLSAAGLTLSGSL